MWAVCLVYFLLGCSLTGLTGVIIERRQSKIPLPVALPPEPYIKEEIRKEIALNARIWGLTEVTISRLKNRLHEVTNKGEIVNAVGSLIMEVYAPEAAEEIYDLVIAKLQVNCGIPFRLKK